MGTKFSAMPAAAAAAAANELAINEAGTSKKLTVQQVATGVVSGAVAPVANTAVSIAAVAPAATTGASQAGKAAALVASAAVASTDTAGAAAGGSVTITSGAAARNTSGNANGGDIVLTPGAGIGTGVPGLVQIPTTSQAVGGTLLIGTTAANDSGYRVSLYSSDGNPHLLLYNSAGTTNGCGAFLTGALFMGNISTIRLYGDPSNARFDFVSGVHLGWSSSATNAKDNAKDTGLARSAAGIVKVTDGSTGYGSLVIAVGAVTTPSLCFTTDTTTGLYRFGSNELGITAQGAVIETWNTTGPTVRTATGAQWVRGQASELLTLSTSGTTTDTTANLLPANSIIESVVARVTTTITTATNWKLGDATTAGRFTAANSTMTAGTTDIGLVHQQGGIASDAAGPVQTAAAKVRVTTTGTPGAGAIRITVFYRSFVGPTS